MKYLKPINEFWGDVLKRDLLGETREEDRFHNKKELQEYLISEIEKQGENVVIKNLDVSLVEDLKGLFENITDGVKSLDLSGWDTSNASNIDQMFRYCKSIESLDLSGWNTSNVKNMSWVFCGCYNLKSLDLSGWDTSNVIHIDWSFCDCVNLKSLDLSDWDTSKVVDMQSMFWGCKSLESLN